MKSAVTRPFWLFVAVIAVNLSPARAVELKLQDAGVSIRGGGSNLFLGYPTMRGGGEKVVATPTTKIIEGNKATVAYTNGGSLLLTLDNNKLNYKFSGFDAEVKNWKVDLSLPVDAMAGGQWKMGDAAPKPFPASKAAPPHLFQGSARSFSFGNKAGSGFTVQVPEFSFLQLTDLREWGTSSYTWSSFSPFYTENPSGSITIDEATVAPAPAATGDPAQAPSATKVTVAVPEAERKTLLLPQDANKIDDTNKTAGPFGSNFTLVKDWTFGSKRPNATIRNRVDLDREFYYRYFYENGKLDTIPTYWTVHRDYPESDPRNLHVLGNDTLTLKAKIPPGGGLRKKGIESGMLRSKISIGPGTYIEMRAKLTTGIGAWPAFWLNPGVQNPDGTFGESTWPPEIDIFEFFNWQGRPTTRKMSMNVQVNKQAAKFGNPYNMFSLADKNQEFEPGFDFSEGFHVFALDWRQDQPMWILDGQPIKQMHYVWNGPPAHILITNQLGIDFGDMKDMKIDESKWDYVIDYIRVWKRN